MKKIYTFILLLLLLAGAEFSFGQTDRKVSFSGQARSLFYADHLRQENNVADTITTPKLNSGHVLADLGVNIRPNKNTEILGMVRIRNDYGGFWGSGVTFDVRQLYVKGVIGGIFRYQLGDINYRMTRYTMWNYDQEVVSTNTAFFQQQTDVVNYDHFYMNDHSRRQQGAAGEFALVFKKWVQELQFHMMTSRVKPSDFATVSDRLFTGLNANLVQSKFFEIGVNYASMYDVPGTSRNTSTFHNPVITSTVMARVENDNWKIQWDAEAGNSRTHYRNSTDAPDWNGKMLDSEISLKLKNLGINVGFTSKYVSSGFRSPGAQTKRIDFSGQPVAFQRFTNDQILRPMSMLDLMRESDFYTLQLRPYLMNFSPAYDNITPFGDATPNRQGMIIKAGYEKKNVPVKVEVSHSQMQEVRGEGTKEARQFTREMIKGEVAVNKFFASWKNDCKITFQYRKDKTTRSAEEKIRGVNLHTEVFSAGLELEIVENFDLLLGQQYITYNGFDFTAIRNNYSEIYNFAEYEVAGHERMSGAGLRYRFSDNAFLSANFSDYSNKGSMAGTPNYRVQQFMLLYSMKF